MPDYPKAALTAAHKALIETATDFGTEVIAGKPEDLARAALDAAAPILAGHAQEAVTLLEEALHIRMQEERAPGGTETWRGWDRKAERFLRSLSPVREDGDRGH